MNQKEYTFSNKDRKFLSALMLFHFSLVLISISWFGFYYKSEINDCRRVVERLNLAEWATDEVEKAQAEKQLEDIKRSYKTQGIEAEEFNP